MKFLIQLIRIFVAYLFACIICAILLYLWMVFVVPQTGNIRSHEESAGLFTDFLEIVVGVSIVPATICFCIAEWRGINSKMTYAWTGLLISLWPFIPMFFVFPALYIAPLLGFGAGLGVWFIAGRHAGLWHGAKVAER